MSHGHTRADLNEAACVLLYLDDATGVNDADGAVMCEATSDNAFGYHDHFVTTAGDTILRGCAWPNRYMPHKLMSRRRLRVQPASIADSRTAPKPGHISRAV